MLKALLVDDDMHMLDFLQKMIPWENVGFCVCGAAANGAEALALVQACQPDVVITDVKMPVMDGLEFCQHLNALNDALPVIIISAYEDMETARYAMKYNVTEYLLKPMNARKIELLCSILRELAQSKCQQAVWVEICESVERQQAIAARLRSGDKAWLEDFFLMLSDCLLCQFQLVRSACTQLLRIYYDGRYDSAARLAKSTQELGGLFSKMEMVEYVQNVYFSRFGENAASYRNTLAMLKTYIEQNYTSPLFDSTMVSERFHFSIGYLNRIFTMGTGSTINAYLQQLRIERAKNLLQNSDVAINSVAELSGYSNQNYFARAFKKKTGITPSEYRLQHRIAGVEGAKGSDKT